MPPRPVAAPPADAPVATPGAAGGRPRPANARLFALHRWLGMNFGLLLALVCLSGAVATLTHEIEWATDPALRIDAAGPVRWQATYEALQRAHPGHAVGGFSRGEPSVLEGLAWSSYVTAPDGSWGQVRVDPHRAEVVRPAARLYLTDFVRQFHYNFHGVWGAGFYLVCFIAFPLLLSVVSGLLFFKGWWRHLFTLRLRGGARAFWSSLHRLLGVWSLVFGVIIAVTGVWYLAERDLVPRETAYPAAPKLDPEKLAAHGDAPRMRPLDELVAAAVRAFPGLRPTGIQLPDTPGGVAAVQGRTGRALVRDRADTVFLDPFDAAVVSVRRSDESGALKWWVDAADALHFGYWGGLASKLLWAFLALCLPALVLSGAWLSLRRAGVLGPQARARDALDRRPWWRRLPARSWVMAPLLVALAWSFLDGYRRRQATPAPTTSIGEASLGPWRALVWRAAHPGPEGTIDHYVRLEPRDPDTGLPNLRRLTLRPADGDGIGRDVRWSATRFALPAPAATGADRILHLEAETWSGGRLTATLPAAGGEPLRIDPPTRLASAPAGAVFWIVVGGLAALSLAIAAAWLAVDRRPLPTRTSR